LSRELDPAWNIKVCQWSARLDRGDLKLIQVSLLEFGGFRTTATNSIVVVPTHASYTNPALPSVLMRKISSEWEAQGGPDKGSVWQSVKTR